MSEQMLINIAFGLIATLFGILSVIAGWFVNNMWGLLRTQQKQLNDLSINVAQNYITRTEMQAVLGRILDSLDKMRVEIRDRNSL